MELSIQALDTLFFRDGKPFARGDETWADSTFPPNPSVVYGAMRTALSSVDGKEIQFSEVPKRLSSDTFCVKGIYFKKNGVNYLPLPLDLVEYKSESENIKSGGPHSVRQMRLTSVKSVLPKEKSFVKYLLVPDDYAENLEGGLISEHQFGKYLAGGLSEINDIYKLYDFVVSEPKVGIGRNDTTKSAEEGLLYRVDTKRLCDIEMRIIADAKGFTDEELHGTIVHLGGETKLIRLRKVGRDTLDINKPTIQKQQFKIYLSTPAIFLRKGWMPDLEKFDIRAELVACCVGKSIPIGGYDIAMNTPKPMLKAVPAGSVYYYESEESPQAIMDKIHGKSISDYLPEQGYGIAFIGNF